MAALIEKRFDARWIEWMRPWVLIAWCFLTLGITLGSWWAYRVLGWGGFWFWDPVENASLLPWLVGTGLIHSLRLTEKRNIFKSWVVFLAIGAFSLSLMGTFLVRSGILTSVHTFATDPTRGAYMLKFLSVVIGGSLLLYAFRASSLKTEGQFGFLSRETMLLSNTLLMLVMMATILLGTLYPLFLEAMGFGKISVGPPYFNAVFIPLVTLMFILMGIAVQCHWQKMEALMLLKQLRGTLILSVAAGILIPLAYAGTVRGDVMLGMTLAAWVVIGTVQSTRHYLMHPIDTRRGSASQWGMTIAHLGIVCCLIGITFNYAYQQERDVRMKVGESINVGPYLFQFIALNDLAGPNYQGVTAKFHATRDAREITLQAEKRIYTEQKTVMSVPGIDGGFLQDLYVAMGEPLSENEWSMRIYYKPFVRWIWTGGIMIALGAILAAFKRRKTREIK